MLKGCERRICGTGHFRYLDEERMVGPIRLQRLRGLVGVYRLGLRVGRRVGPCSIGVSRQRLFESREVFKAVQPHR